MHSTASFRDRIKGKGKQQQCNDAQHFCASGAVKSRNNAQTRTLTNTTWWGSEKKTARALSLHSSCNAFLRIKQAVKGRLDLEGGNVAREKWGARPYTVGTPRGREKCTHWGAAVQRFRVWSPRAAESRQTHSEKHVDIANNTANTQRNLRLTVTTGACDCTVQLEVTWVEGTPRKTFSTQIGCKCNAPTF